MNVVELIKEKLEKAGDLELLIKGGRSNGKTLAVGYCAGIKEAISIVDEVAKEYEEKYMTVPKDDFTEDLLNMGYTKGIKDGYNKAIDDFVEKAWLLLGAEDVDIYAKETINEIAEQLKGGSDDD